MDWLADQDVPKDKAKPKVTGAVQTTCSLGCDSWTFFKIPTVVVQDAVEFQVNGFFAMFLLRFFPNVSGIGYFLKSEIFVTYCQIELELNLFSGVSVSQC